MSEPVRRIAWPPAGSSDPESLVTREWLVTNGLGGYASGTVPGVIARRYHGLLIAALPAPLGRMVMLSHVAEQVKLADVRCLEIGGASDPVTPRRARNRLPHGVSARIRPAGLALRRRGAGDREAMCSCRTCGTRCICLTSCFQAPTASELSLGRRSTSRAGIAGQRAASAGRRISRRGRAVRGLSDWARFLRCASV